MVVEETVANSFRAEAAVLRQQQLASPLNDERHILAKRAAYLEAAAAMLDRAMEEAGL